MLYSVQYSAPYFGLGLCCGPVTGAGLTETVQSRPNSNWPLIKNANANANATALTRTFERAARTDIIEQFTLDTLLRTLHHY